MMCSFSFHNRPTQKKTQSFDCNICYRFWYFVVDSIVFVCAHKAARVISCFPKYRLHPSRMHYCCTNTRKIIEIKNHKPTRTLSFWVNPVFFRIRQYFSCFSPFDYIQFSNLRPCWNIEKNWSDIKTTLQFLCVSIVGIRLYRPQFHWFSLKEMKRNDDCAF